MEITNVSTSLHVSPSPQRRRNVSGITLVEVVVSITIFALFVSAYAITFPPVIRSTAHAANYLKASDLARHKIEQLRQMGYTKLTLSELKTAKAIDTTNASASGPFTFATIDNLVSTGTGSSAKVGYFGPSTNATGTITVGPTSVGTSSPPTQAAARQVTVTVAWTGGGTPSGSYTTQTVIVAP